MDNFNHQHIQLAYKAIYNDNLCEELENLGLIEYEDPRLSFLNEGVFDPKKSRLRSSAERTQGALTRTERDAAARKAKKEAERLEKLEKAAQAIINQETGTPARRSSAPMGSSAPRGREEAPAATRRLPKHLKRDTLGSAADRILKQLKQEDYECILSYLIDEGYVDSLGAAEIILENMSDEWLDELLDEGRIEQLKWKYTQRYGKPEERDTLRQHVARKKYEDAAKSHQSGYGPSPNVGKSGKLTKGQMMYKAHRSAQSMRGQR